MQYGPDKRIHFAQGKSLSDTQVWLCSHLTPQVKKKVLFNPPPCKTMSTNPIRWFCHRSGWRGWDSWRRSKRELKRASACWWARATRVKHATDGAISLKYDRIQQSPSDPMCIQVVRIRNTNKSTRSPTDPVMRCRDTNAVMLGWPWPGREGNHASVLQFLRIILR